ncbi:hypothetical protein ACWKWA_12035 [Dermacoccus abyssi]
MTTADTKGHTMNRTITTTAVGALTLTALLTGCGQDAAKPAPTTSTPTQHIKGGNDPRYKQGVDAYLAFEKLIPGTGGHMPAEAAKYGTEKMIRYQNETQDNWFGGKTDLGKVKSFDLSKSTVDKYQGMDIFLDTPTRPYEMTVRACGTTKGSLTTDKGKQNVSSTAPVTLYFKSDDKGKSWKVDQADVNAPSSIKLGCEQASTSSPSPSSPSKG